MCPLRDRFAFLISKQNKKIIRKSKGKVRAIWHNLILKPHIFFLTAPLTLGQWKKNNISPSYKVIP